jgi:hypothetical protein
MKAQRDRWQLQAEATQRLLDRTRNFEACGHFQSKKMQKFLLRSALQPN